MQDPNGLKVRSPAKINWMLRVLRRREDGYHEIETLMSTVTLYDELIFTPRPDRDFSISCNRADVPTDGSNLVCRAAALLAAEVEENRALPGWHCRLLKHTPVGGGVGGGSSNAAATLRALNRLWSLDLPEERLAMLAGRLGSDVPFFLHEGTAVVYGRGERVRPIRLAWHGWIVLICPGYPIPTAEVYRAWRAENGRAAYPLREHDVGGAGCDAVQWMEQAYNMLEKPAMQVSPELAEAMQGCRRLAGRPVRLSGSGSSMFTAFDTRNEAEVFADQVSAQLGLSSYVVQPTEQA